MLFFKGERRNQVAFVLGATPDEIASCQCWNDPVVRDILWRLVAVEFLIRPILEPLVIQLVTQEETLSQDVRQRLAAVDGEVDDVVEECGHFEQMYARAQYLSNRNSNGNSSDRIRAMTPELEKEVIVGILSAFFTALFTGIPAAALFWWSWRRDQERLVVQKLVIKPRTSGGSAEREKRDPTFGILIRNRSLFPAHVGDVSFKIDGNVIRLEDPGVPNKTKRNTDAMSSVQLVLDENFDPWEIPSQASLRVNVRYWDHSKIVTALSAAGTKLNLSNEDVFRGPSVEALVESETGKEFTSVPLRERVKRAFAKALLPPESGSEPY
jgi:hypothetical protein